MSNVPPKSRILERGAIRLDEDWQVHSTFSDGTGTVAANVDAAAERGLRLIVLNDHVSADTLWVADFVAATRDVGRRSPLIVLCALEAKILDTAGRLDLPPDAAGADLLLAADHQVPSPDGPRQPREIAAEIVAGRLEADTVLDWIVTATIATMAAHPGVLIAHLFSVLPKIGLSERDVPAGSIEQLADAALRHHAIVEVSERWTCPSLQTMRTMSERGVRVVASTDAHRPEDVGRYQYCATVAAAT